LNDLEKHGYDTPEKKKLIGELCIKYRNFPYASITTGFEDVFTKLGSSTTLKELDEFMNKFNDDSKIQSLLEHFIIIIIWIWFII
jgi:hypothetical protein